MEEVITVCGVGGEGIQKESWAKTNGPVTTTPGLKRQTPLLSKEGWGLTRSCFFCECSSIFCFMLSLRCCRGSFSTSLFTCRRC